MRQAMKRRGLAGLVLVLALALVVVGWRIWRTGNEVEVLADRLVEARQSAAEPCIRLGQQLGEVIAFVSSISASPRESGWLKYYVNGLMGATLWINHCAPDRERVSTLTYQIINEDASKDQLMAALRELRALVADPRRMP